MQAEINPKSVSRRRSINFTAESRTLYSAEYRAAVLAELAELRQLYKDLTVQRKRLKEQTKTPHLVSLDPAKLTDEQSYLLNDIPTSDENLRAVDIFSDRVASALHKNEHQTNRLRLRHQSISRTASTISRRFQEEFIPIGEEENILYKKEDKNN